MANAHFPSAQIFSTTSANCFPQHQAWFVTSDSGPVLDANGQAHRQDFGLAVFISEHIPVVAQATKYVHGSFVDHHEWTTSDRPRIAQGLRLVDRVANRYVTIVHTHGLRDPSGKHDTPARHEQARALASLVESVREPDDFAMICGDLNLLPDSETFDTLRTIGLTDLVGEADTRTSLYTKPLRHANYCLVSNPGDVLRFEAPATPEVSDHRPLVVEIDAIGRLLSVADGAAFGALDRELNDVQGLTPGLL